MKIYFNNDVWILSQNMLKHQWIHDDMTLIEIVVLPIMPFAMILLPVVGWFGSWTIKMGN